jgi:outer membrane protein assembly factor BamB
MGIRLADPLRRPRVRRAVFAVAAVVLLVATAGVGYRVLAPAETLSAATSPYPDAAEPADSRRYGNLAAAPLILDGRLRVYAEKRRLWADTPVTARLLNTPFWAYRRWPAELIGVAAAEHTGQPPMVLSLWSDGALVAVNPTSGTIAWRAEVEPGGRYEGRRTGARTVYEPLGLLTASTSDGLPVLLVSRTGHVRAYDPWTGQQRWDRRAQGDPKCHDEWSAPSAYLDLDTCASPPALDIVDAGTGQPMQRWSPPGAPPGADITPWGCTLGRSGCQLLSVAPGGNFRVTPTGDVVAEPYAHTDNQVVAGDAVVEWVSGGYARAVSRRTGDELWRTQIAGYVAAVDQSRVYVVDPDEQLTVLALTTGAQRARIKLRGIDERDPTWWVSHVYVRDGFVALERMSSENARDPDSRYYFGKFPVVLAGSS